MQSVWADGPLSTLINRIESAETESNIPLGSSMKDPALLKMKLFKKLPKYLGGFRLLVLRQRFCFDTFVEVPESGHYVSHFYKRKFQLSNNYSMIIPKIIPWHHSYDCRIAIDVSKYLTLTSFVSLTINK